MIIFQTDLSNSVLVMAAMRTETYKGCLTKEIDGESTHLGIPMYLNEDISQVIP